MKILKSGIEMTPKELSASKGGAICACACQIGFISESLHASGEDNYGCYCGCIKLAFSGSERSAREY
jgi:hypothetical protein